MTGGVTGGVAAGVPGSPEPVFRHQGQTIQSGSIWRARAAAADVQGGRAWRAVFFALVYAIALAPFLPFGSTAARNLLKGLVFGTVLAVVALLIMTPLVYVPARDFEAGFFSSNFGWSYIVSVFIFHWVYGLHLGLIYNPDDSVVPRAVDRLENPGTQLRQPVG